MIDMMEKLMLVFGLLTVVNSLLIVYLACKFANQKGDEHGKK